VHVGTSGVAAGGLGAEPMPNDNAPPKLLYIYPSRLFGKQRQRVSSLLSAENVPD
jgi:hypothetical protein